MAFTSTPVDGGFVLRHRCGYLIFKVQVIQKAQFNDSLFDNKNQLYKKLASLKKTIKLGFCPVFI